MVVSSIAIAITRSDTSVHSYIMIHLSGLVDVADSRCGVGEVRIVRGICERSGVGQRCCVRGVGDWSCMSGVGERSSRVDDGCRMRRIRDSGCGRQIARSGRCGDADDEQGEKSGALVHDDEVEEVAGTSLRLSCEDCPSCTYSTTDTEICSATLFYRTKPLLCETELVFYSSHPCDLEVSAKVFRIR